MAVYDDTNPAEMLKIYNKGADIRADPAVSYRFGEITIPHIDWIEPLRLECEDFANAIRLGVQPRAGGRVGLAVVQVLAPVQQALEKQQTELKYRGYLLQQEIRDGVHVIRVWSYISPDKGFLPRILWYLSFALLAPLLGARAIGQPDVIIVQSPPLFDAIAVRMLAWWKRCPFVFMVSDLWPEAAVQLGVLRNPVLIKLSEWLEWSTYRRASLVWVVTEWIRDFLIQRGLPAERVFLLTNGVDTTKFRPLPQAQARAELGWDDKFTVLYVGTHGVTHGLITLLDAAEQIQDRDDIRFVLVGDGADKQYLIAQAQERGLKNIRFLDPVSHALVPTLLAAGAASLSRGKAITPFEILEKKQAS
jgi:glycosyltransferase involved in cell wall biosynthesis